jgi:hypothetical protein
MINIRDFTDARRSWPPIWICGIRVEVEEWSRSAICQNVTSGACWLNTTRQVRDHDSAEG